MIPGSRHSLFGATTPYVANAVAYNGSTDYLTRGAALTGVSSHNRGILRVLLRTDLDGVEQNIFCSASTNVQFRKMSDNKLRITLSDGVGRFDMNTSAITASSNFVDVMMSWDMAFSAGSRISHLYINDVSDKTIAIDSGSSMNVKYDDTNWSVAALTSGSTKFTGAVSELYFYPAQYIDFSVAANRRLFRNAAGKPIFLGASGQIPLGSSPAIYLPNPAATVGTNAGTGGNFTVNGTPSNTTGP